MVKFYPKFYTFGSTGNASIYIKDTNGFWQEFVNYSYFKLSKKQNQISEFEVDVFDLESAEKAYVKEFAEVLFFSEHDLILKGRIQSVEYTTAYACNIKGFGMEAKLLDREFIKDDDKRVQYDNSSAQTIANEVLSANSDGASPWILTPPTTGIFDTDYGDVTLRFEYASRLKALAKLTSVCDYDWWITQSEVDYETNYFNLAQYGPSNTRALNVQETYAITGADANCSQTSKESDIINLANKIDILGYGDGDEQLKTSTYNASETYSFLSADITAAATTIGLDDASDFASSGTIRIAEEQITYTGKTDNNLTGCTRGANSTTAYSHKKGVYTEKYTTIASADAGSSIGTNTLMDYTVTDRSVIDRGLAELIATKLLLERKDPIVKITVIPNEPIQEAGARQIGDLVTITDAESGISDNYRIVGMKYVSNYGNLSLELECSNRSLNFIEQLQNQKDQLENLSRYMQGATNLLTISNTADGDETADSGYVNVRFFIPDDVITISEAKINFKMKPIKQTKNISEIQTDTTLAYTNVPTSPTEVGNVSVDVLTGQKVLIMYSIRPTSIIKDTGLFSYIYVDDAYESPSGGVFQTVSWINEGSINFTSSGTISEQMIHTPGAGNFKYSVYAESVAGTEDINGGILTAMVFSDNLIEGTLTDPSVGFYIGEDGESMTLKGTYTTDQDSLDITGLVQDVGANAWVNLQFRPNKEMRIEANAYVRVFIESKTT